MNRIGWPRYVRLSLLMFLIILSACQGEQQSRNAHSERIEPNHREQIQLFKYEKPIIEDDNSTENEVLKKIYYINNVLCSLEDNHIFIPTNNATKLISEEFEKYIAAFCLEKSDYLKDKIFPGSIEWMVKANDLSSYDDGLNVLTEFLVDNFKDPNFILKETCMQIHDISLIHSGVNMNIYGVKYMLAFKPKDGGEYYGSTTYDLAIIQDSKIYFTGLSEDILEIFRPLMNETEYSEFINHLNEKLPSVG